MEQAIELGGRDDERNLFDRPGGYHRLMNNQVLANLARCVGRQSRRSLTWEGRVISAQSARHKATGLTE